MTGEVLSYNPTTIAGSIRRKCQMDRRYRRLLSIYVFRKSLENLEALEDREREVYERELAKVPIKLRKAVAERLELLTKLNR